MIGKAVQVVVREPGRNKDKGADVANRGVRGVDRGGVQAASLLAFRFLHSCTATPGGATGLVRFGCSRAGGNPVAALDPRLRRGDGPSQAG